jgi:hypothetical protein
VLGLSRCHSTTPPTTHRSSGVDMIYEDKRLQPVTACIMCVFTDEDAPLAAGYSNVCRSLPSIFSTLPLVTSTSASGNNFKFAWPQPRSTFRANAYWADSKPTSRRVVKQALTLLSVVLRSIHPSYPFISYAEAAPIRDPLIVPPDDLYMHPHQFNLRPGIGISAAR